MNKPKKSKKALIIGAVVIALAILLVGGYFAFSFFFMKADPKNPENLHPYFSFDASKAPGWFDGMNSSSKGAVVTEDTPFAPKVSFTIMEGESPTNPKQNGCFIMYFLFDASTSIEAREQYKHRFDDVPQSGVQTEETGIVRASLVTPEGTKSFDLHQQHYVNNSEPIMEGGATGYVSLTDGFIEVQAICKTIGDIPGITAIIPSVTLLP